MDKHFNFNFSKCVSAVTDRQENDFRIIGFGFWDFRHETMDSYRRIQPYYSLLYVVSGTQYIEVNNKTYAANANELFIMPKDIPFRSFGDQDNPPSHVFFEFVGDFASSYLEDIGFTLQNIVQKCPEPKKIREELKDFILKNHQELSFSYHAVLSAFFSVLSSFSKPQNNIYSLKMKLHLLYYQSFHRGFPYGGL